MWPKGVVVTPPGFDEDLGFFQRIEDLPIEKPVAQSRIEALDVAVLPGRARRDEGRAGPDRGFGPRRAGAIRTARAQSPRGGPASRGSPAEKALPGSLTIVQEHVAQIHQFRLAPFAIPVQPRLRVGRRLMRDTRPPSISRPCWAS